MTPRPFNSGAKVKRLRTLFLTILISVTVPLATFFTDLLINGSPRYGWLGALAQNSSFLLMGVGLVTSTLYSELLRKQKSAWEKEFFGKLSMAYIAFCGVSFAGLQTFTPQTAYGVYLTALFILITYYIGIAIAAFSILAGKS